MANPFFETPILNGPYAYPMKHWELDDQGQPTQKIITKRRLAEFITPIPKAKKQKGKASQQEIIFDEAADLSTAKQKYNKTSEIINQLRDEVTKWRNIPNPNQWQVTPETARLLQHWRNHKFSGVRPFFCQVEAAETAVALLGGRSLGLSQGEGRPNREGGDLQLL